MSRRSIDNIEVKIVGEITDDLKEDYAKELARILIEQYDIEFCKRIIDALEFKK